MAEPMRITERRLGDVTLLELEGHLALDEGDTALRDYINRIMDQGRVKIVLDMQNMTRLNSAGIGMLVSKYLTAYRKGGGVKLLHVTMRGDHLLKVTKLHTVFEIFESEDEAIRSFGLEPVAKPGAPRL
jgi:anti-sigma B factor antagonist